MSAPKYVYAVQVEFEMPVYAESQEEAIRIAREYAPEDLSNVLGQHGLAYLGAERLRSPDQFRGCYAWVSGPCRCSHAPVEELMAAELPKEGER